MERIAIILLLLIATTGCMTQPTTTSQTQDYVRPAIQANVNVGVVNATNKETGVILSVSDFEKMARTSMDVGDTLELPTRPPATITLESITQNSATITVNNQTRTIQEEQGVVFEQGALYLQVARIISSADTSE